MIEVAVESLALNRLELSLFLFYPGIKLGLENVLSCEDTLHCFLLLPLIVIHCHGGHRRVRDLLHNSLCILVEPVGETGILDGRCRLIEDKAGDKFVFDHDLSQGAEGNCTLLVHFALVFEERAQEAIAHSGLDTS